LNTVLRLVRLYQSLERDANAERPEVVGVAAKRGLLRREARRIASERGLLVEPISVAFANMYYIIFHVVTDVFRGSLAALGRLDQGAAASERGS